MSGARAILLITVAAALTLLTATSSAQITRRPILMEMSSDRTEVGRPITVRLTVEGVGEIGEPRIGPVNGISVSLVDRSESSEKIWRVVGGRQRQVTFSRATFVIEVTPTRTGIVRLPPIRVRVGDRFEETLTRSILSTARADAEPAPAPPPQEPRPTRRSSDDMLLELAVSDDAPFVGEPIELTITIYARRELTVPRIDWPSSVAPFRALPLEREAPRGRGLDVLGDSVPVDISDVRLERGLYHAIRASRWIVCDEPGVHELGAVRVRATLHGDRDPRYGGSTDAPEAFDLSASAPAMRVRSLPRDGRPAGFRGPVGRFGLRAEVGDEPVRENEPVRVRVAMEGRLAHLSPMSAAQLDESAWQGARIERDTAWETDRSEVDVLAFAASVLTDASESRELPPVRAWYFDPDAERYRLAETSPVALPRPLERLVVARTRGVGEQRAPAASVPDIEWTTIGSRALAGAGLVAGGASDRPAGGPGPAWLLAIVLPPVVCSLVVVAGRRRSDPRLAAMARFRRRARRSRSADALAHAIRLLAEDLTGRAGAGATPGGIADIVREIDVDAAAGIANALAACDADRFSRGAASDLDAVRAACVRAAQPPFSTGVAR